jgi:hypothetical protein
VNDQAIAKFGQSLRGALIGRSHPEYEEARKLYNAMIDKRPLLIARCADVGDVIAAVNFGRENKLPIAVRGGGHNGPGLGSVNDGLVIDLSTMKGVRVDPVWTALFWQGFLGASATLVGATMCPTCLRGT